jgi:hypothetical protein
MDEGIETARLSVAEIDDQAIAEIGDLIGESVSAAWLIALAAAGPLVVARAPCGKRPEIVGVAWVAGRDGAPTPFCKVRAAHLDQGLEARLRAALKAQLQRRSLFRRRDRAPLGLTPAFRLQAAH